MLARHLYKNLRPGTFLCINRTTAIRMCVHACVEKGGRGYGVGGGGTFLKVRRKREETASKREREWGWGGGHFVMSLSEGTAGNTTGGNTVKS